MTSALTEPSAKRQAPAVAPAARSAETPAPGILKRLAAFREKLAEHWVPDGLERDTEPYRRARLIVGFGFLAFLFACFFAIFYLFIGHFYGAGIVVVCGVGVGAAPVLLRATRSIRFAGNWITLVLLLGFGLLCAIEGGVRGHAIGWLAAVPLCALLLVSGPEVGVWCLLSVIVTVFFVVMDLNGLRFPPLYPERWHALVTAAGYIALTFFMAVLGIIFEGGRRRAFARMERAHSIVSEMNSRLKVLDGEKNDFLGMAAHDLKNPLNIVMGYAELIAAGKNFERSRDDARYIIEAADGMIALINRLLDVNAIEQGRFPIQMAECDLGKISRKVVAGFSNAANKKQIAVYATGPLDHAPVLADPKALWQILENLLSNAIKYSPPGRDVFVRLRAVPDGVVWEVQDQGAGLSEEDQAFLFRKFTKLSTRPTGGESSTGLGLSIVKMLAEAMGGSVGCSSKAGEGATFWMRLLPATPTAEGCGKG